MRPSLSIASAPAPCTFSRKTRSCPSGSSLRIESVCSCANSTLPSGAPTMPSAVAKSAQTSSHSAPASTTPGIAEIDTGPSPGSECCEYAIGLIRPTRTEIAGRRGNKTIFTMFPALLRCLRIFSFIVLCLPAAAYSKLKMSSPSGVFCMPSSQYFSHVRAQGRSYISGTSISIFWPGATGVAVPSIG